MKKNKKWEWPEPSHPPQNPYASHQPPPQNPYASHQPTPNPYASHQPTPNPYASHQPPPQNPYASHQPPQNPYASHQPTPNPYASHQPPPNPYAAHQPPQSHSLSNNLFLNFESSCDMVGMNGMLDTLTFGSDSTSVNNLSPSPTIQTADLSTDISPSSSLPNLFSSVFLTSSYHLSQPGNTGVWSPREDFEREQKRKEEQEKRRIEQENLKPEILKMFQNELYLKQQSGLPIYSLSVEEDRLISTDSTTDYENYSDIYPKSTKL